MSRIWGTYGPQAEHHHLVPQCEFSQWCVHHSGDTVGPQSRCLTSPPSGCQFPEQGRHLRVLTGGPLGRAECGGRSRPPSLTGDPGCLPSAWPRTSWFACPRIQAGERSRCFSAWPPVCSVACPISLPAPLPVLDSAGSYPAVSPTPLPSPTCSLHVIGLSLPLLDCFRPCASLPLSLSLGPSLF